MLWAEANRLDLTRVPPDNALVQSVTRKIVDQSMNAGLRHSEERNRIQICVELAVSPALVSSAYRSPRRWKGPIHDIDAGLSPAASVNVE